MTRRCGLLCAMVLGLAAALPGCMSGFSFSRKGPACEKYPPYEKVQEGKDISQFSTIGTVQRHLDSVGTFWGNPTPGEAKSEQAKPPIDPSLQPAGGTTSSQDSLTEVATFTQPPVKVEAELPPLPTEAVKHEPLVDALECILDGRHNEALQHLRHYDQGTQEFYLRMLPVLALMTKKPLDQFSGAEVAVLHQQLNGLLMSLRPRTELAIERMCFCEWIQAYGIYKPLPEGHSFLASTLERPGEWVQLYVELKNFDNVRQGGYYETRLASTVEIRPKDADPKDPPTWSFPFDDRKQPLRSRTLVSDYFKRYTFYVPHLPPGTYTLTIEIADETRPENRRLARKSLQFRVTSLPARGP